MATLLYLIFGMMAVTSVQIDVVYYYYLRSRAAYLEDIRIETTFNSRRRKIWRVIITLGGLVFLYLAGRSSLDTMPEQFPLIVSVICGFILWVILLNISTKVFLTSRESIKAEALALAFIIPLALIGLFCIMAHMYPSINSIINRF